MEHPILGYINNPQKMKTKPSMNSITLLLDIKNLLIEVKQELFHQRQDMTVLNGKLDNQTAILTKLIGNEANIKKQLNTMGQELDDLKTAVTKDTEVGQSAITLLTGLKAKLDDAIASGDPQALKDLSTQLGTNADALAAAVVANTPAA